MKKIGLVLSATPAYSETFFNSKIKGLIKNGFEVVLFVTNNDDNFTLCDVKKAPETYKKNTIKQFLSIIINFLSLVFYIKRVVNFIQLERSIGIPYIQVFKKTYINSHILRSNNIDWLHFGFGTSALGKEHLGKVIDAKLAVSFRGFDIGIYPVKHPNCYNLLWNCVHKVHVISDDILNLAYNEGMPNEILVEKITPAIDVEFFKSPTIVPEKDYKGKINFLTVGRLHWKKGYEDTLKALQILKEQGINFNYVIVGGGKDYERIAFAAYQYGLSGNITFNGKLTQAEIIELMNQTDVYLQYSIQEGFCNAVLEAQSLKKTCIVSDAEGLSENIIDGKTGWVVPKRNPKLLASKITEVLSLTNKEKKKVQDAARNRIVNEFSLEQQQCKFRNFYIN